MKKVIVIGGGFAGLSASVDLAENNFEVTLIEASPKLGGRAYSVEDPSFSSFDNGQHIFMGCYDETLSFLEKIGSYSNLDIQESLSIPFVRPGGNIYKLAAKRKFYPLNILHAILNYQALSLKERFKVIDFFLDLICCYSCDLRERTVKQWLDCKRQSDNSVKSLWEIITVGALNTRTESASAEIFSEILKTIFFTGKGSSKIILSKVGLSELYCTPASDFITERGGKINLSERAIKFTTKDKRITGVISDKYEYRDFDAVLFAIPAYALEKISSETKCDISIPQLNYSPIVNVHFLLNKNPFTEKFYGLIGSEIHWVFNHGSYITAMTSAADNLIGLDVEKIYEFFTSELKKYFPIFHKENIISSKVIKEKRATFIPDVSSNEKRNSFKESIGGMFVAGDWTSTGLPSTVESAVSSGRRAAQGIITSLK